MALGGPILKHIRVTTKCTIFICNLTYLHKIYMCVCVCVCVLKLLWKRGEIAPKEQFLLLFTIFFTC